MKAPRLRFAPSPTGNLHVGNARAGIFNWLFAKKMGGEMFLRIEDTDLERSRPEYVDSIFEALTWLKIDWHGDIVFQSARMETYQKHAKALVAAKKAYFCQCSPELLEQMREESIAKGVAFTYPGTCANLNLQTKIGETAVRLRLPEDHSWLGYDDLIRGRVDFPREQMDDFIILRSDGSPTYNFCVVIDDFWMKITHVIRGEDHISNTPKQLALYQSFDYKAPQFAHLPMILSPTGGRLSKRDGAVSVKDYKTDGFLPEAMFNYLVRLGWSHGDQEIFSQEELCKLFSLDHIGKKGAVFDRHKLEWLNGEYLKKSSAQSLLLYCQQELPGQYNSFVNDWPKEEQQLKLLELYKSRVATLGEFFKQAALLAHGPHSLNIPNHVECFVAHSKAALLEFAQNFDNQATAHDLLAWSKTLCTKFGMALPFLAQPLRLAVTGSLHSPSIFELVKILEPQEVVARIHNLCNQLQ